MIEDTPRPVSGSLVHRLTEELQSQREGGQPLIDEQEFLTGKLRVTVIWDAWNHLSMELRTAIILHAYELTDGIDFREKIALASGLTVPEACAAGMLPFQIIAAVRPGDSVTWEECRQAMLAEGASELVPSDKPQLRFATEEEAESARKRLIKRLPLSEPIWIVSQDIGRVEDWIER